MQFKNHYKTLELKNFSSLPEIKKAYRRLVKKYHPDSSKANTTQKFLEIQEAYELLSNPKQKLIFDFGLRQEETKSNTYQNTSSKTNYTNQERKRTKSKRKRETIFEENNHEDWSWHEIAIGAALIFGAGYLYGKYKRKV